jgi:hypothetical protein
MGGIVSTGVYTLFKTLRYTEVNGTEDRDDTMLVARIEGEKNSGKWINLQHSDVGSHQSDIVATVFQPDSDRMFIEHRV